MDDIIQKIESAILAKGEDFSMRLKFSLKASGFSKPEVRNLLNEADWQLNETSANWREAKISIFTSNFYVTLEGSAVEIYAFLQTLEAMI